MRVEREYIVPIICTVILHAGLLIWMMGSFMSNDRVFDVPQPKMVRATLVSLEQKRKKGPRQEFKQPKPKDPTPVAKADPTTKPVQKKPEPKTEPAKAEPKPVPKQDKPKPKPEPDKPKIDPKKLKEEAQKKLKAEQQEKQKKENLEKEKLAKAKAEKEKAAKEAAEKKRQEADKQRRQQALLDSLESNKVQEESDPDSDATESSESYIAMIQRAVIANWSRPVSARNGMLVLLRIQLIPTGEVVGVTVHQSSGDTAFDRSAVAAVEKAHIFPEISQMDSRTFESNFRTFILKFNPQDLRF